MPNERHLQTAAQVRIRHVEVRDSVRIHRVTIVPCLQETKHERNTPEQNPKPVLESLILDSRRGWVLRFLGGKNCGHVSSLSGPGFRGHGPATGAPGPGSVLQFCLAP